MRTQGLLGVAAVAVTLVAGCAAQDDGEDVCACEPAVFTYVIDAMTLPLSTAATDELGHDLDDDGTVDNQLGVALTTLAAALGDRVDLQAEATAKVEAGELVMLAKVTASALTQAANVGLRVYLGSVATPAPCVDPTDPLTCGQHLGGDGRFEVSPASPLDAVIAGNIIAHRFEGGPGTMPLQLAIGDAVIAVRLIDARVELADMSEDRIAAAVLAGAISMADVEASLIPAVDAVITGAVADPTAQAELRASIAALLVPDVDSDEDGAPDALSLGIGASAVAGVLTAPTE